MKLHALSPELLQRVFSIYQDLAYGATSRPRRVFDPAAAAPKGLEGLLGLFQKETLEPAPGCACARYWVRLGNRNYPYMKLMLQEHLIPGEFFFAVDTHDDMEIRPDYPGYEAWMVLRRFNRDLKRQIESGFDSAGIDTSASLRRLVCARADVATDACRGLVLVVDDEEDLAAAVGALLQARGYRAVPVLDPRRALHAARELRPDVVLLDYEMPELDGMQVLQQLRADPDTQTTPILLSSAGKVSLADIGKADGFLGKPFQETMLLSMLERARRGGEPPARPDARGGDR